MDSEWSSATVGVVGKPRAQWPSETDDFAPWLIENLGLLGEQLGLHLRLAGREVPVGRLRADIVAEDEQGRKVIIEAQFGPSDHKHLGQIVTYACAAEAAVIVWVVTDDMWRSAVREEHLATLAKLNEVFGDRCAFYAVEVSLESDHVPFGDAGKLDTMPVTPRMRVRCRPS